MPRGTRENSEGVSVDDALLCAFTERSKFDLVLRNSAFVVLAENALVFRKAWLLRLLPRPMETLCDDALATGVVDGRSSLWSILICGYTSEMKISPSL